MKPQLKNNADVIMIGAGPAGSMAAALLRRAGFSVLILEKELFPRFSIGESLLPQSTGLLEEAGMLKSVVEAGFQHKNGAMFARAERRTGFDFRDKFSQGWGTTYQVQRAIFDQTLADEAAKRGVEIRFGHTITAIDAASAPKLHVKDPNGQKYEVTGRFLIDASGFGRVVPRLLGLDRPSDFPSRKAIFTHVEDKIEPGSFDRNKILITIHPKHVDVWYWLIPFSNGRCSLGVVAETSFLDKYTGNPSEILKALCDEDDHGLKILLANAVWDTPARHIMGYACDVTSLYGNNFVLLGNAGEFLDPVFSSGVTIAFKSASLAAPLIIRQLNGETIDWQRDFADPLKKGVDVFRAFVKSWYKGGFQNILFYQNQDADIRRKICSILAGYAWDLSNPFVAEPERLGVLERYCEV